MKTLAIQNGDLVIGPTGHEVVSGVQKISQDILLAIIERYGSDPYHPRWGSLLDRYVGQIMTDAVLFDIQQEALRVVSNYIAVQTSQIQQDVLVSQGSRFSASDVVRDVSDIQVSVAEDPTRANVRLQLVTANGQVATVQTAV